MKTGKTFIITIVILTCLLTLAGCSQSRSTQAANELHFNLERVSEVTISYDEEPITFFQSDSDELVIKEYMSINKNRYYADVKQDSNSIHISEGGKPFFKGNFSRYIKVYFPEEYQGSFTVTTTDGNIDISDVDLKLSSLRIDSTAGTVCLDSADASAIHLSSTRGTLDLGNITGEQIQLETTSGKITCEELAGTVTYTSTSGDIDIESAVGSGSYKANNSGKLQITYTKVTGDLSFFNKNDNINLELPKDLDFEFEATTKNGTVSTTFQGDINVDGRTTYGTIGNNPTVAIKTETNNGNIEVTQ